MGSMVFAGNTLGLPAISLSLSLAVLSKIVPKQGHGCGNGFVQVALKQIVQLALRDKDGIGGRLRSKDGLQVSVRHARFSALVSQGAGVGMALVSVLEKGFDGGPGKLGVAHVVVIVVIVAVVAGVVFVFVALVGGIDLVVNTTAVGDPNVPAVLYGWIKVPGGSHPACVRVVAAAGNVFDGLSGGGVANYQVEEDAPGGPPVSDQAVEPVVFLDAVASVIGPRLGTLLAGTHGWTDGLLAVPPDRGKPYVLAAQGLPESAGPDRVPVAGILHEGVVNRRSWREHLFKGSGRGRDAKEIRLGAL